jgi:hypothetical protein
MPCPRGVVRLPGAYARALLVDDDGPGLHRDEAVGEAGRPQQAGDPLHRSRSPAWCGLRTGRNCLGIRQEPKTFSGGRSVVSAMAVDEGVVIGRIVGHRRASVAPIPGVVNHASDRSPCSPWHASRLTGRSLGVDHSSPSPYPPVPISSTRGRDADRVIAPCRLDSAPSDGGPPETTPTGRGGRLVWRPLPTEGESGRRRSGKGSGADRPARVSGIPGLDGARRLRSAPRDSPARRTTAPGGENNRASRTLCCNRTIPGTHYSLDRLFVEGTVHL